MAVRITNCCRTPPTLARLLDVDQRTIQRNLRRLEVAGHIRRIKRGDFQTDLYELATPRQMPPTVVLEILPDADQEEAKRGGNPPAASGAEQERQQAAGIVPSIQPEGAETCVSAPVVQDEDGLIRGPGGAIVYPEGAAFVPAGAEAWYNAMMQAQAKQQAEQRRAETHVPVPTQIALDNAQPVTRHERDQDAAKPAPSARRRRTQKRAEFVQPGELVGRIIAATRKAEKLEKGNATQKRQARAIRYQIEQLERKLAALRAELDSAEAQAEGQPEGASSQPPASRPTTLREDAPPLGFLPDVRVPDAQELIARLRQRQTAALGTSFVGVLPT